MSDAVAPVVETPVYLRPSFCQYRMVVLTPPAVHSLREAVAVAWGMDIFFGRVPILKTFAVLDILWHVVLS